MKSCHNIKEFFNTPTNIGRNTLFSSLTFTGKERDEETGYSYHGARYYDSETSGLWLSVDPMADKYPGISPYAYCAWNPVKLVDPNGDSCKFSDENAKKTFFDAYSKITKELSSIKNKDCKRYQELSKMKGHFDNVITSNTVFVYSSLPNIDNNNNKILEGGSIYMNEGSDFVSIDFIKGSESTLVHETRHASGLTKGEWDFDFTSVTAGQYGLLNYDLMDEFDAYKMQYTYGYELCGGYERSECVIKQEVLNYVNNRLINGIIPEFIQYTRNNPYIKE